MDHKNAQVRELKRHKQFCSMLAQAAQKKNYSVINYDGVYLVGKKEQVALVKELIDSALAMEVSSDGK